MLITLLTRNEVISGYVPCWTCLFQPNIPKLMLYHELDSDAIFGRPKHILDILIPHPQYQCMVNSRDSWEVLGPVYGLPSHVLFFFSARRIESVGENWSRRITVPGSHWRSRRVFVFLVGKYQIAHMASQKNGETNYGRKDAKQKHIKRYQKHIQFSSKIFFEITKLDLLLITKQLKSPILVPSVVNHQELLFSCHHWDGIAGTATKFGDRAT